MNIGISTSCFYPMYTEHAIDNISKLMFSDIEIFFNSDSELDKNYLKTLKEKLDFYNISVKSIHPFHSAIEGVMFFSDYKRRTEDSLDTYSRYFEAAAYLGAKFFTFHGDRTMTVEGSSNVLKNIKFDVYKKLCSRACDYGISIAQENVAWCRSSNPLFLNELYRNVPELLYTLDIKQAKRANTDYSEYINIMSDRLCNIHINDYSETESCLLPGEGILKFEELFRKLKNINYNSSLLIEVYSSNYKHLSQITESAEFLRKICF